MRIRADLAFFFPHEAHAQSNLPLEDHARQVPSEEQTGTAQPTARPAFLVGTVRERPQGNKPASSTRPPASISKGSKLSSADREIWLDEEGKPMSAFRKKRLMAQGHSQSPFSPSSASAGTNELDGNASEMPTRISREAIRAMEQRATSQRSLAPQAGPKPARPIRDQTRDPGGGASPEAIQSAMEEAFRPVTRFNPSSSSTHKAAGAPSALSDAKGGQADEMLASVSSENDGKISGMSEREVQLELKSLERMFGKEVLERLRSRKMESDTGNAEESAEKGHEKWNEDAQVNVSQDKEEKVSEKLALPSDPREGNIGRDGPSQPPELIEEQEDDHDHAHTHAHAHPHATPSDPNEPHFSISGQAFIPATAESQQNQQEGDAYSIEQILQLCRSSVSSQRALFFGILARVLVSYPPTSSQSSTVSSQGASQLITPDARAATTKGAQELLISREVHTRSSLLATWMLADKARNVREVALECLTVALSFLPASLVLRRALTLNTSEAQRKEQAESARIDTMHDAVREMLAMQVVEKIQACLREAGTVAVKQQCLTTLEILSTHDVTAARLISSSPGIMDACLRFLDDDSNEGGSDAGASVLRLCLSLALTHRDAASALAQRSQLFSAISRMLYTKPWEDEGGQPDHLSTLNIAIQFLAALAKYGYGLSSASLFWNGLADLCQCTNLLKSSPALLELQASVFEIFEIWTICAEDPHASTQGGHDIVWDVVKDLPRYSLATLQQAASAEDAAALKQISTLKCIAAAAGHARAAVVGARRHTQTPNGPIADESAVALRSSFAKIAPELQAEMEVRVAEPRSDRGAALFSVAAKSLQALASFPQASDSLQVQPAADAALQMLAQVSVKASDIYPEEGLGTLRCSAITIIISAARLSKKADKSFQDALLRALQSGEEQIAQQIVEEMVSSNAGASILMPFYVEAFRSERSTPLPLIVGITSPAQVKLLSSLRNDIGPEQDARQAAQEDKDVDPLTGSRFWKCPANGLPLRSDWPLLPLDDLSHSGNSAVFNRPGSLPADWDANERDIVFATLSFAVSFFQSATSDTHRPQAADLWLAVIKVFLLEKADGASDKATGTLTGKDLFRDPAIASILRKLASLTLDTRTPEADGPAYTLEMATARIYGSEVPFFQLYTDLLGIYDSVSYGDAAFALTVVQPLAMCYPVDYRRILWLDYAHLLPSIRVRPEEVASQSFLLPRETSAEMLDVYGMAVCSRKVTKERNPLLFHVAVEHLSAAIWHEADETHATALRIRRLIFHLSSPTEAHEDILHWHTDEDPATILKRKQLIEAANTVS